MLGFGALGQFALGEGPFAQTRAVGGQWSTPLKMTGLAVAVVATSFVGFVPPPPAQAETVFTQFSQPQFLRSVIPDEQPSALFEVRPPALPLFTSFAKFDLPLRAKINQALYAWEWWQPITLPVDTHDGVYVKRKRKHGERDPIDEEVERKARLRAGLELAIYGPEVSYEPEAVGIPVTPAAALPNIGDLAGVIQQAQAAQQMAQRRAIEADDEDVLELILRDL